MSCQKYDTKKGGIFLMDEEFIAGIIAFFLALLFFALLIVVLISSSITDAVSNLRIEKLEIGFNESKIIEWANQTINKEQQESEQTYPIRIINFTCFGMSCSPSNSIYIKGVGVCYNQSEGIVCPV